MLGYARRANPTCPALEFAPDTTAPGHDTLTPLEYRFALLDKRLGRIAVIFGLATMNVVGCFQIQTVVDIARRYRAIEVLLHVAIRNRRTAR